MKKKIIGTIVILYFNMHFCLFWGLSQDLNKRCENKDNKWVTVQFLFPLNCSNFEQGDWTLVLDEQFTGTEVDPTKWWPRMPWGDYLLEDDLSYKLPENNIVNNGILKQYVVLQPGSYPVPWWSGSPTYYNYYYTSAAIWSKQFFKYGKFEIRCKIPKSHGVMSAFWLYAGNTNNINWTEIDIFEYMKMLTELYRATIFYKKNADDNKIVCRSEIDDNVDYSQAFHVYSLEWDEFKMIFRIDGIVKRTDYHWTTTPLIGNPNPMENCEDLENDLNMESPYFDLLPMPLILSNGIPGSNVSLDDGFDIYYYEGPYPAITEVDYIKVYQRKNNNRDRIISSLNYDYQGSIILGRNIDIHSNGTQYPIEPSGVIKSIIATNSITLDYGFEVQSGAEFSATIQP
jgi:hypothetical protein